MRGNPHCKKCMDQFRPDSMVRKVGSNASSALSLPIARTVSVPARARIAGTPNELRNGH